MKTSLVNASDFDYSSRLVYEGAQRHVLQYEQQQLQQDHLRAEQDGPQQQQDQAQHQHHHQTPLTYHQEQEQQQHTRQRNQGYHDKQSQPESLNQQQQENSASATSTIVYPFTAHIVKHSPSNFEDAEHRQRKHLHNRVGTVIAEAIVDSSDDDINGDNNLAQSVIYIDDSNCDQPLDQRHPLKESNGDNCVITSSSSNSNSNSNSNSSNNNINNNSKLANNSEPSVVTSTKRQQTSAIRYPSSYTSNKYHHQYQHQHQHQHQQQQQQQQQKVSSKRKRETENKNTS